MTLKAASSPSIPPKIFPPRRDYASLSIKDLLDARESYRLHLALLDNVVATAIGRYFIHKDDWYAKNPPTKARPGDFPRVKQPRTVANSVIRPWSWPAVLVFVREWENAKDLGNGAVPKSLYLPDGRIVPTCIIQAKPNEVPAAASLGPFQTSSLLGGGYSCLRIHQGLESFGTISCLVKQGGSYYFLTNRHVAGGAEEVVRGFVRNAYQPIGVSIGTAIERQSMATIFPRWPTSETFLTLDAGLVRIDDIRDWTAQVYGIGEIGELFNATEHSITLDMIGAPVRAFGAASGLLEGQIAALFFQYESASSSSYATDLLIAPRSEDDSRLTRTITQAGDSGAIWFFDWPAYEETMEEDQDFDSCHYVTPQEGARARRYQPIAMQWGGERIVQPDGTTTAYVMASFLSTICRTLDVDVVRDWSLGHEETWGKLGHFSIGFKACGQVGGTLGKLMKANQANIGVGDDQLAEGSDFKVDRSKFVPLADVPDYLWVTANGIHPNEAIQHFADIDIQDIDGGPSLLDRCVADRNNVSAKVWKSYFDGFADKGVGPEEGALPFRVWQLWESMVAYLKNKDLLRFVAAAGVMAHYVGDASQPLHCSFMHHGVPPMKVVNGRKYPLPRDSDEYQDFKKTRAAKIHGIYEETMLEIDPATLLASVDEVLEDLRSASGSGVHSGHDAGVAVIALMKRSQVRLLPKDIIDADEPLLSDVKRAEALWKINKIRSATVQSLADSVQTLAELWAAAWREGHGKDIDPKLLVSLNKDGLDKLVRKDRDFVPSFSLAEMAESGLFEPAPGTTAAGSHDPSAPMTNGRRRRRTRATTT
jgi:hypothetical protein